jgi:signal transduction histidine kinase
MAIRDAASLLSLLGHELRAPAGVIGGYLTLIHRGRERLSADQQQAVEGARRAQLRLVEILDDASRLVATWKAEHVAAGSVALVPVLDEVRAAAAAQGLPLTADTPGGGSIRVAAPRAALVEAIVSVASAVGREHGTAVQLTVTREAPDGATWQVRAATVDAATATATVVREPFNAWRPGLGLRLVVAATVLADAGARLDEVLVQGARVGVDVIFDAGA